MEDMKTMRNASSNVTSEVETKNFTGRYIIDIALLMVSVIGVVADILIIFTVLKYDTLHTRRNTYLANFCLLNSIFLSISPIVMHTALNIIETYAICFGDEVFLILMISNHVLICIIITDWYINTYKSINLAAKCRRSYKIVVATLWLVLFLLVLTAFLQCLTGIAIYPFLLYCSLVCYFICILFLIFFHIMKFVNEKTSSIIDVKWNVEILSTTLYLVFWFPNWIYVFSVNVFGLITSNSLRIGMSTFIIGNLYPTLLLSLLYFKDWRFRICVNKLINRKEILEVPEEPKKDEISTSLL